MSSIIEKDSAILREELHKKIRQGKNYRTGSRYNTWEERQGLSMDFLLEGGAMTLMHGVGKSKLSIYMLVYEVNPGIDRDTYLSGLADVITTVSAINGYTYSRESQSGAEYPIDESLAELIKERRVQYAIDMAAHEAAKKKAKEVVDSREEERLKIKDQPTNVSTLGRVLRLIGVKANNKGERSCL
jgi:hypothetical protein